MKNLNEALTTLAKAVDGTNIDVNVDRERIQIHWFGVTQIECGAGTAAEVIPILRHLETFGMKDC